MSLQYLLDKHEALDSRQNGMPRNWWCRKTSRVIITFVQVLISKTELVA